MRFEETALQGAWLIKPEFVRDERGFFARTWCEQSFRDRQLNPQLLQCSISWNKSRGTLRGLHWQAEPYSEVKLVRCTRGGVYDVIVDVRRESETFGQWRGFELNADNRHMLYVPAGFAHGFLTLTNDSEVSYQISSRYVPELARGLRWDDPDLNIPWPGQVHTISKRDRSLPLFREIVLDESRRDARKLA